MAYARKAGSIESALLDALQHLRPAEVEAATGTSVKTLYDAANPMTPRALSLRDAALLDLALAVRGLGRPFGTLFRALSETGDEALPAPEDALLTLTRRLGEVATAQASGDRDAAARAWEALLIAARQGHAAATRQQEGAPQIRVVAEGRR